MKHPLTLLICILLCNSITSQKTSLFNYFHQDDDFIPTIKIETDFNHLVKKKHKEEYQPGVFSFTDESGEELSIDMKVRSRGNIRKTVCHYPPIKVNFKKSALDSLGFKKRDELKLVLQCHNSGANMDYLLRERFIYDLYKVIDTCAIQAQLVHIEFYKDGKRNKSLDGFLVESEEDFAKRMNITVVESGRLNSSVLKRDHFLKMCAFQYMISNTDWSIGNKHNVEIVSLPDKKLVAVPYDFDYSGFVGTDYAVPHESLGLKSIHTRMVMSKTITDPEAISVANYFHTKKDEFLAVCDKATYLSKKEKERAKNYINGFYKSINNDNKAKNCLVRR